MILQKSIIVFIILLLISMMIQDLIDVYTDYINQRDAVHRAMSALWEQRYRAVSLACAIGLFYMIAK